MMIVPSTSNISAGVQRSLNNPRPSLSGPLLMLVARFSFAVAIQAVLAGVFLLRGDATRARPSVRSRWYAASTIGAQLSRRTRLCGRDSAFCDTRRVSRNGGDLRVRSGANTHRPFAPRWCALQFPGLADNVGDHRRSHIFGLRAIAPGNPYRTHVDCVRDGGVLLVDPTLRDAVARRHAFHALASDYFFAGRRGTLPNFHSYPPAAAAHRGALDSRRSIGSRHSAVASVATLNLLLVQRDYRVGH